jgi:hypothetical protein
MAPNDMPPELLPVPREHGCLDLDTEGKVAKASRFGCWVAWLPALQSVSLHLAFAKFLAVTRSCLRPDNLLTPSRI